MFGRCHWPIWSSVDFTVCFQHDYIQTLFPLIVCSISITIIVVRALIGWRLFRKQGYEPLATDEASGRLYSPGVNHNGQIEPPLAPKTTALSWQSFTESKQTVVELSKPKGMLLVVVAETIFSAANLVLVTVALSTAAWGPQTLALSISAVAVWSYVTLLVALRLYATITSKDELHSNFSSLWYHTASLYFPLWIFTILVFRSQIMRPDHDLALFVSSSNFGLTGLLFLISICSRVGNRPMLLRSEPGLEPCLAPTASILSKFSFWWLFPLLRRAYSKTIEKEDIWDNDPSNKSAAIAAKYAERPRGKRRLWLHLISFLKMDVLSSCAWSSMYALAYFAPSLLLKVVLEYLEHPATMSINAAWLAASLTIVVGLLSNAGHEQSLWIGRHISLKLQALLYAEVYTKTLSRKIAGTKEKALGGDSKASALKKATVKLDQEKETDEEEITFDEPGLIRMWTFCFAWPFASFWPFKKAKTDGDVCQQGETDEEAEEGQASSGAVTSLMSSDIQIIQDACAYLCDVLVAAPLQLILCLGFLFKLLGKSTLVTMACLVLITILQYTIFTEQIRLEKKLTASKDARIHQTSEVVNNVRIVKLFAWENKFLAAIDRKRQVELKFVRRKNYVFSAAYVNFLAAPTIMTALTFCCFTLIEGRSLTPSVAFPALSILFRLQQPLNVLADMINYVQMALVSVNRIEEFLNEADTTKHAQLKTEEDKATGDFKVGFEDASFSWGSSGPEDFKLFDLNLRFVSGINVIFGPTGSGKTSLLSALLGEMKQLSGSVFLPGSAQFDMLKPDPVTGLTESVAYCAQSPWLINNTVKQNILFASPDYNEDRYRQVIRACNLERDIEIWKKGDLTAIGDNGITISGGQKQRISLARALYSSARYLLLDDILSAVDSHTARWIVEEALRGPLVQNRTCVIVSHNTALVLPCAVYSVALNNGRVVAQGTPAEVITAARLSADESGSHPSTRTPSRVNTPQPSQVNLASASQISRSAGIAENSTIGTTGVTPGAAAGVASDVSEALNGEVAPAAQGDAQTAGPEDDIDDTGAERETKAVGSVSIKVLFNYLRAAGGPVFYAICFFSITLRFGASVAQNAWIRVWANSYGIPRDSFAGAFQSRIQTIQSANISLLSHSNVPAQWGSLVNLYSAIEPNSIDPTLTDQPSHPNGYYIGIYALIGLFLATIASIENLAVLIGALRASQRLHRRLMESLAFAKWRWYDTTPNGRITNRFTNDMTELDEQAAGVLHALLDRIWDFITCVAVICYLLPPFVIAMVILTGVYIMVARFYINCSRDMKRISSVMKSPILQHFQETLSGVVTIRAYAHQHRFVVACQNKADDYLRPFFFNWAANRWLSFMVDSLSISIAFITMMVVVSKADVIDAGSAGLAITYSLNFSDTLNFLMRFYAALEQNMNAVERVIEFTEIEREADPIVKENRAPANWPEKGAIRFQDYSTRYAPQFDYALKDLSFEIPARAKVGVIGRTGAGKSSLALALFRALEPDRGSIYVDGVDISELGLHDLREGVLMVPQDPTLFQGTIRSNLDPFGLFTDEEIFDCLRKVHLIDSSEVASQQQKSLRGSRRHADSNTTSEDAGSSTTTLAVQENQNNFYNLSTRVAEEGRNFSQGQRQLMCLARALLKSPKILLMDEATASIDYATDVKIQAALREFKHTFITIAHRLRTIIDYDKILVLEKGCLKEYGHPWELLQSEDSQFHGMCQASGELESLRQEAEKAYRNRDSTLMD